MRPLVRSDLRKKLPSSRTRLFSRITPFDLMWAGLSPVLAFVIRDGTINRLDIVIIYSCVALVASIIAFQWFKISSPIPTFFSIHDAITVSKACLTTAALTAGVVFTFTRLDASPRSIPIMHFLVLGCGLVSARALNRLAYKGHPSQGSPIHCEELENILIIGATRLAWFFSKMVEEFSPHERRIVAIVDERPSFVHRTLNGYSIVGSPKNLSKIVDEYATHGVVIGKVIVATQSNEMTRATWVEVQATCKAKNIRIESLQERFLFSRPVTSKSFKIAAAEGNVTTAFVGRAFWKIKRFVDIVIAVGMMIAIAPLVLLVAGLVVIDVGYPIVFWQQRIGYRGRPLNIYKFRTMRNSFDRGGQPRHESERLSLIGRLLRRNRLDELPQLVNILTGGMSLIGPRPLLPVDQPKRSQFRLQVRPGLSGLAQVSGGKLLSPDEKEALDEWYIQNATLLLDISIIIKTIWMIIRGERRNESLIAMAIANKDEKLDPLADSRSKRPMRA